MGKDEIKAALLTTTLGECLNELELNTLIVHSRIVRFSPGEFIVKQGKVLSGMYVIIQGTALATAKILGEAGTYIATLGKGNLAGEVSLIERSPSAISIIASTEVNCLLISDNYFSILDLIFPETKYKITWAIANEVGLRITNVYQRILNFLSQNEMVSRSIFTEIVKTLTKTAPLQLDQADVKIDGLEEASIFSHFNEENYNLLLKYVTFYKAPKNCVLIAENNHEQACYIVLRGAVQSSIVKNNKVAKLSVLGPMHLIANLSIINDKFNSTANYTTCERSVLLKISQKNILKIKETHRGLWFILFDLICKSYVGLEHAVDKLDIRLNSEFYNR